MTFEFASLFNAIENINKDITNEFAAGRNLKGIPYPGDLVSIKFKNLNDPRIYPGSTILPIIAVEFLGQLLWTSTHDYRKLLENSLVREPFEPFLRRACLAVIEKSNYLTEAIKK